MNKEKLVESIIPDAPTLSGNTGVHWSRGHLKEAIPSRLVPTPTVEDVCQFLSDRRMNIQPPKFYEMDATTIVNWLKERK